MTEYYQIEDGILKLYTGREEVVWVSIPLEKARLRVVCL